MRRTRCRDCSIKRQREREKARVGDYKLDSGGYAWIRDETGVLRHEHRLVMEAKLKRPLRTGESVHHLNGIRHDNRPENLELWLGGIRHGQRASDIICPHCGLAYAPKAPHKTPE